MQMQGGGEQHIKQQLCTFLHIILHFSLDLCHSSDLHGEEIWFAVAVEWKHESSIN